MIQAFVDQWRNSIESRPFEGREPKDYKDLVESVIKVLNPKGEYNNPDPKRVHEINDGDYQGTLVYVIGSTGYQPSVYWYVKIAYGSCSGCDALESIKQGEGSIERREHDYMLLALHIVEGLTRMND